ncbi:MAG TPA: hypothetical protein VKT72_07605 [Candidatus Baltobacteraceae bacterium]|nr:hypothetical protein [Candidatus Baltobacteraceae bacterium]
MTRLRLLFYVLYVVLGIMLLVRLLALGFHWQIFTGVVLALALIVLGVYRLMLYARMRGAPRR